MWSILYFILFIYQFFSIDNKVHITDKLISDIQKESKIHFAKKRALKSHTYYVGQTRSFFVRDLNFSSKWKTKSFELLSNTGTVRIWISESCFSILDSNTTHTISTKLYHSLSKSDGILSILEHNFGSFLDTDSDNKVDILLFDINEPFGVNGTIAGYFDPVDLFEHEYSNRMDIIYIDVFPSIINSTDRTNYNTNLAEATIAHELQHLIFQGYKKTNFELTFINEGLSELAEILCGYPPRPIQGFLSAPFKSFFSWNYNAPLPDYSRASLWFHYLQESYGNDWIKSVICNEETGLSHFDNTLNSHGISVIEEWKNWYLKIFSNHTIQVYQHPERRELFPISLPKIESDFKILHTYGNYSTLAYQIKECKKVEFNSTHKHEYLVGSDHGTYLTNTTGNEKFILDTNSSLPIFHFFDTASNTDSISLSVTQTPTFVTEIRHFGSGKLNRIARNVKYLELSDPLNHLGILLTKYDYKHIDKIGIHGLFNSEFQDYNLTDKHRAIHLLVSEIKNDRFEQIYSKEHVFKRDFGVSRLEWIDLEKTIDSYDSLFIQINSTSDLNSFNIGVQNEGTISSYFSNESSSNRFQNQIILSELVVSGYQIDEDIIPFISIASKRNRNDFESQFEISHHTNTDEISFSISNFNQSIHISDIRLITPSFSVIRLNIVDELQHPIQTTPIEIFENGLYKVVIEYSNRGVNLTSVHDWNYKANYDFKITNTFPNPFNPRVNITLQINKSIDQGLVQVYDILGRLVLKKNLNSLMIGKNTIPLDMKNFANGIYLIQFKPTNQKGLQNTNYSLKKVTLLK